MILPKRRQNECNSANVHNQKHVIMDRRCHNSTQFRAKYMTAPLRQESNLTPLYQKAAILHAEALRASPHGKHPRLDGTRFNTRDALNFMKEENFERNTH